MGTGIAFTIFWLGIVPTALIIGIIILKIYNKYFNPDTKELKK